MFPYSLKVCKKNGYLFETLQYVLMMWRYMHVDWSQFLKKTLMLYTLQKMFITSLMNSCSGYRFSMTLCQVANTDHNRSVP